MLVLEKGYYKKITIPKIVANDAYIYLRALQLGFTPVYFPNKAVLYKSPTTLADHLKQASRYKTSFEEIDPYITEKERSYFQIPKKLFFYEAFTSLVNQPVKMISYICIQIFGKIFSKNTGGMTWEVASSTKKV